ncbi:MAG: hypothetical protein E7510_04995 [Ruminococcus sp.]|nr:hypothetical protein [Ruminococcus sp.]
MNKKYRTLLISGIMALNMMSIPTSFADDKAVFLETFEKYFDIYKCTATYVVDGTRYLYLLEDENAVNFITAPENSTFTGIDELSSEEWYYTIKDGMLDAYIEDYCEKESQIYQKPFKIWVEFVDENGEIIEYVNVTDREEANAVIEERGAKEGSYTIKEYFAGGGFCYYIDPQFEDEQLVQYIDKDGNILEEHKIDSEKFAYKSVSDCAYKRIVFVAEDKEYPDFIDNDLKVNSSGSSTIPDYNSDSVTDLTDLTALSLYLIGDTEWTDELVNNFDCNADGTTNLADLAHLKQYIMGEDVKLG